MFVVALIGNALASAWLYDDPRQFQLGMALEPLFALAVAQQLAALAARVGSANSAASLTRSRGLACAVAAVLIGLRAVSLVSLALGERRTDNPMLSGRAQRALVELLSSERIAGDDLITTSYDHVGVIEALSDERLRPIHAWRLLGGGRREEPLQARWGRLLDAHPACHVLLTRAANLEAGSFSDDRAVAAALEQAAIARGARIAERRVLDGDGGRPVYELADLAPCGASR
jgi:hypothetical protein